jgi:hypothetical protein
MHVTMVPKEYVPESWDSVKEYLEGAAKYTYGRYEVDDIYDSIIDYDYNLWIAFDGEKIKGAVVTKFNFYPRKKFLDMVFCGGEDLPTWKEPMLKMLQHWAFDNHCDGIESTGRPGWAKVFAGDGHRVVWHTYELPVAESGLGVQNG